MENLNDSEDPEKDQNCMPMKCTEMPSTDLSEVSIGSSDPSITDNSIQSELSSDSSGSLEPGVVPVLMKSTSSVDLREFKEHIPFEENPYVNCDKNANYDEQRHTNGLIGSILSHPAYKTVIRDLASLKEQIGSLNEEIKRLEGENQRLEADHSHDIYLLQMETLEKTITEQQQEIQSLKESNHLQSEASSKSYTQMKFTLESKVDELTKKYETANKEKEAMVVRYAISEKEVIQKKKELESIDKKYKEMFKEKELLMGKLKSMTSEKARICQMLDGKYHELTACQRENEKLKEEINNRDVKIKWTQNKLKTEMEALKESQTKLEKLTLKLQETKEECELIKRDCQETIKNFQVSEENRAYTLDQQLKELQAKLITERHNWEDKEGDRLLLLQEIDNLKKKHHMIIEENNQLSVKVQNLEKERLEYEHNLSTLKQQTSKQQQDIVDLQAQVVELESLKIQLQREQDQLSASKCEIDRLRQSNAEQLQEMMSCRHRESELLEFTQKLTEKNVRLQTEFSALEAKSQTLESEQAPLQKKLQELEIQISNLQEQLSEERKQHLEENKLLARHLAEKTQQCNNLTQQLEDQQGENQLLKKKNTSSVKELTRELHHLRKRLEQYEVTSGNNALGQGSRTSSCNSLNEPTVALCNGGKHTGQISPLINLSQGHSNNEPSQQVLMDRIVELQNLLARQQEKLEFFEENTKHMIEEIKKKSKIIHHYVMREQTGALASEAMDKNKAELARHGGIMASLHESKTLDSGMTLELSLEINKQLQAVLEDTILKNITLKENIDTLGMEIAKLTIRRPTS